MSEDITLKFVEGTSTATPSSSDPLIVGDPTNGTTHAVNGNYLTSLGAGLKNNLTATADPTTTDDAAAGYSVNSLWTRVDTNVSFICVDSTNSAAIWNEIGLQSQIDTNTTNISTNTSDISSLQTDKLNLSGGTLTGALGIGSAPNAAAFFDIVSTTLGSRPYPSMTAAQRDAISSPVEGLIVYNTDDSQLNIYDGSSWGAITGGGGGAASGITIEYLQFDQHAGYGSTNTAIPYFTNERENLFSTLGTTGNDSTNGASLTASKKLLVFAYYSKHGSATTNNDDVGITIDADGTTSITSISTAGGRVAYGGCYVAGTADVASATYMGILNTSEVLRPHSDGNSAGIASRTYFTVIAVDYNELITGATAVNHLPSTIQLINPTYLTSISDLNLTGNNASFDGGGTITASSLSLNTTAANLIRHSSVISYDPNADGSNDYFGYTFSVPIGLRGRFLGFSFEYKNDSTTVNDDFRFAIKFADGASAGNIQYTNLSAQYNTDGNAKEIRVLFYCPSDCTSVEAGFQNTTATTTVALYVDNWYLSSDPYLLQDVVTENIYSAIIANAGSASITSQSSTFISSVNRTGAGVVDVTFVSNFFAVAPALQALPASADFTVNYTSLTTSGVTINTYSTAGVLTDTGFSLLAMNQGADYQAPENNIIAYTASNTSDSMVRLHTLNGYGATNTKIRRFSTAVTNTGSAITYADSASDGASFTINETGLYDITYTDHFTSANSMGISLNSSQLTTDVTSITTADRLTVGYVGGANFSLAISWSGLLNKDDVIRPHTNGTATGVNASLGQFTIAKIGKGQLFGVPPFSCRFQKKYLASDIVNTDGTISDLTFSNLEIGKCYVAILQAAITGTGSDICYIDVVHNSVNIGRALATVSTSDQETRHAVSYFIAAATTVTFVATSFTAATIAGDGSANETFATLIEMPLGEEVSIW